METDLNNISDAIPSDIEDITDLIKEYKERNTIPIDVSPARAWVSQQLKDLATKITIDTDIQSFEVSWDLESEEFVLTTHLKDLTKDDA